MDNSIIMELLTLSCHASTSTSTYLFVWIWLIPFIFSFVEYLECMSGFVRSEAMASDSWILKNLTAPVYFSWAQQLLLGSFVDSPSPLESWGNGALVPPILGKSMVIKLTATWRLSWMPTCCCGWERGLLPLTEVKQKHRTKRCG